MRPSGLVPQLGVPALARAPAEVLLAPAGGAEAVGEGAAEVVVVVEAGVGEGVEAGVQVG